MLVGFGAIAYAGYRRKKEETKIRAAA